MATKKENSPILIKDKDGSIKYTLEFTRRAVVFAERNGFILEDIPRKPVTGLYDLFYYAFQAHHKGIRHDVTDEIFDELGGLRAEGLLSRLVDLYNAACMPEQDEGGEKNAELALVL